MRQGNISRAAIQVLAIWLGVLQPIVTCVQLYYDASPISKLPSGVVAAMAALLLGAVTYGLWAAIRLWRGDAEGLRTAESAMIASFAANMLGAAPMSILMSAPPTFLPSMICTLLGLAFTDHWERDNTATA